jgi:hypothetical protein
VSTVRDPGSDQPLPEPGSGLLVHQGLIALLGSHAAIPVAVRDLVERGVRERQELGTRKYGRPLEAHNGRDAWTDAWEELLDAAAYLHQMELEGSDVRYELHHVLRALEGMAVLQLARQARLEGPGDLHLGQAATSVRAIPGLTREWLMTELDPEALRQHIQVQLERIASESALRSQLLQEEMDRRLANLSLLWTEKANAASRALGDLKIMLDERHVTQVKAMDKAFDAQQVAMATAFTAADKAIQVALSASKEASLKAESAAERRFEAVNEFRGQLSDQARTFLPRQEWEASRTALAERMNMLTERFSALELRLSSRLDRGEGSHEGSAGQREEHRASRSEASQVVVMVIMSISVIVAIVATVIAIVKH